MIESLLSVVGQRGVDALAFLLAFALTALMDSVFHDKLPHDHGREFAVNGALSKGKARGSGLIFVLCIALVSLAFLPFKVEYVIYTILLIASMLSGYFDDAAETAWNEYKKGIIDFAIAIVAGVTYLNFNGCVGTECKGDRALLRGHLGAGGAGLAQGHDLSAQAAAGIQSGQALGGADRHEGGGQIRHAARPCGRSAAEPEVREKRQAAGRTVCAGASAGRNADPGVCGKAGYR